MPRGIALPIHDAIGAGSDMRGAVSLPYVNAERRDHRGHRRIDVLIRAGHQETARLQHTGERGHGSAADSNQMVMHRSVEDL